MKTVLTWLIVPAILTWAFFAVIAPNIEDLVETVDAAQFTGVSFAVYGVSFAVYAPIILLCGVVVAVVMGVYIFSRRGIVP